MIITELSSMGEASEKTENLLNEKNSSFMANYFFKFLFITVFGMVSSNRNFSVPSGLLLSISFYATFFFFPIACLLEIFFKERERKPNLFLDCFIILIILGINLICEIGTYGIKKIVSEILTFAISFIIMIVAYIFYDVLVYYKINGSLSNYSIMDLYNLAKENSEKQNTQNETEPQTTEGK